MPVMKLSLSTFAFRVLLVTFALAALPACPRPAEATGCQADRDCNSFERCEVATGFCLCADDQACDATEFCNAEGRCQPQLGCNSNNDCKSPDRPSDICDTTTGQCITLDAATLQCVLDSHCPFGAFCDQGICRPGCRENGDCGVDTPCINGQCDATPGACNQDAYCQFGQLCDAETSRCVDHRQRSDLCEGCRVDGLSTGCPGDMPCLFDSSVPPQSCSNDAQCASWPDAYCLQQPCFEDTDCGGGATCEGAFGFLPGTCSPGFCTRTFCGSDSCDDETDPCPRGYNCFQLITVTGTPCTLGDNTCQGGRSCRAGGENNVAGFCSCVDNSDCPIGTECVNPGPGGFCLQGTTCGPSPGLLCEVLQ